MRARARGCVLFFTFLFLSIFQFLFQKTRTSPSTFFPSSSWLSVTRTLSFLFFFFESLTHGSWNSRIACEPGEGAPEGSGAQKSAVVVVVAFAAASKRSQHATP